MDKLIEAIEPLIKEELGRANERFPLFRSDHEGGFVIQEEIHEAREEMAALMKSWRNLKLQIYREGSEDLKQAVADQLYISAMLCACEMVQVAAMCIKFTESWKRCETDTEKSPCGN